MGAINTLLRTIDFYGLSSLLYRINVGVTWLVLIAFLVCYRRRYHLTLRQSILLPAIAFPPGYLLLLVITWAENGFRDWGSNNIVRLFVLIPVILWVASRVMREPFLKLTDYLAPGAALLQAFGHLVCIVEGCCRGYPCSWGVWNRQTGDYRFPCAPLESLVAFLVMVVCIAYAGRRHYDGSGRVYPLFLILFGATRFGLEFLRDNDKLFWGISELALHAALMVVVGAVWLLILRRHRPGKIIDGEELPSAMA